MFEVPNNKLGQSAGFFHFRYSWSVGRGGKDAGKCVVKSVVIETQQFRRMTVLRAESQPEASYRIRFSNWKEGRRRPHTIKWWIVMLGR